jgi:plasmid stability protein
MPNLTITVDDDSLKKARIRALSEGTSVNALLRDFLESYAGVRNEQAVALREIILISRDSRSRRGDATWNRDELHERH